MQVGGNTIICLLIQSHGRGQGMIFGDGWIELLVEYRKLLIKQSTRFEQTGFSPKPSYIIEVKSHLTSGYPYFSKYIYLTANGKKMSRLKEFTKLRKITNVFKTVFHLQPSVLAFKKEIYRKDQLHLQSYVYSFLSCLSFLALVRGVN